MPIGLIFTRWNELIGNEVLAKYPKEVDITDKNLMQIFNTHDFSGKKGMISLLVGSINIISYYSGKETNYCVVLLLSLDDDPEDYEDVIAEVSQIILQNLKNEAYLEMFPSLYDTIKIYPLLTFEQRLTLLYSNDIKRSILYRLRDEGLIIKSDLNEWLQEKYLQGYGDLNTILFELVQKEIIEIFSVKSERSLLISFINDIIMFRIPPFNLLKNSQKSGLSDKLFKTYKKDCDNFFEKYIISEDDNLRVINLLNNYQAFELMNLLREGAATINDLEKLREKDIDNIENLIQMLKETQIIKSYLDSEGNEYFAIISNFYVDYCLPEYILNVIKTNHNNNLTTDEVLLKYLDVLHRNFVKL